jgi:hypothetical protein
MFDFVHWCSWSEAQSRQPPPGNVAIEFRRGQPSPKQGAAVAFKTGRKLMQFAFWETGEADFYGLDLITGSDIVGFHGRMVDDHSFEQTFRECLSKVA